MVMMCLRNFLVNLLNVNMYKILIIIISMTTFLQESLIIAKHDYNCKTRIALVGSHGVGKTTIMKKVQTKLQNKTNIVYINEVFRDVFAEAQLNPIIKKAREDLTLAVYAKQLYLESIAKYNHNCLLIDRSVYDAFIYNDTIKGSTYYNLSKKQAKDYLKTYTKVYLIEPSDREIENDGFRFDTSKENQLAIHTRFLSDVQNIDNLVIVNQEDQNKIVNEIVNLLQK